MRPQKVPTPHRRDGKWYLVRRVPKEFAAMDKRVIVRVSTEISIADDPRAVRAGPVVLQLNRELEAYWRGLRDGAEGEVRERYERAQQRARQFGLAYQTAAEIAAGPIEELLRRVAVLTEKGSVDNEVDYAAVMGGEEKPALSLSSLVDEYEKLQAASLQRYSPNQKRKWRLPRDRVVKTWKGIIEDIALTRLTRSHGLQLRDHYSARIVKGEIDIGTANTEIGTAAKMLKTVAMVHHMEIPEVLKGLRFAGETDKQRKAFAIQHIQNVILGAGALDGLNSQARAIVWVVADTGLRLSEAANLLPEHIHLNADVPYVQITPVDRALKTQQSERDIPLVGSALAALKLYPGGFPRYRDKGGSLSAAVNKFMRKNGMLPERGHSIYSLRHAFEDRLTAVEAPEKVIAALMGHKYSRPRYGAGPSLAQKREWMSRIAFTPPEHFGPLESKKKG